MKEVLITTPTSNYNFYYVFFWVLFISLGSFYFGYQLGVLAVFGYDFSPIGFNTDSETAGFLSTIIPLAAAVGAFTAGQTVDKGRRKSLMLTHLIGFLGPVIQNVPGYYVFLTGRALCGLAVGLYSTFVPLMISEISPLKIRGPMGIINSFSGAIGITVAYALGLGPYDQGNFWRFMVGLPGAMAFICLFVLSTIYTYETPVYYIRTNQRELAVELLQKIYTSGYELQLERIMKDEEARKSKGKVTYKELFGDKYRKRFYIGIGLSALQKLSGINAILSFAKTFLNNNQGAVTLLGSANIAATIVGYFLIKKVGRKTMLLNGTFVCGIFLGLYSLSYHLGIFACEIAAIVIYYFIFSFTLGAVVWLYIPEIVPDTGVSLTTLANWTFNFIVAQAYNSYTSVEFSPGQNMLGFGILCFVGVALISVYVKETQGKTGIQIDAEFGALKEVKPEVSVAKEI